ncbi:hypothetical protein AAA799E16_00757 [Marine Group I thaumarchaeote SCGC AAA799-E16]|uniref:Uncharacterized protein n=4 Tax=Marine Group I TaxID=905826 RepID=A0A087S984_9ARCH|nr:hypothetical protein AAA799N04_01724 [Marine Group I thaumarchaeote SCGC AAA799-N04]KER06519.1 hypothetical protein AAA799E16_00757 [Marine Group I thaumarchaeote SCGC AAA799-E16]KFM18451.1 hypothetical protein SCCGRSA3_01137 [Marine Group I thaumarchaeote SCGC RSA3]KFM22288.1 hypothetical protein AAA799B03_00038 [Marine Group I thaumarchaeote SCGC AAA799-B03]
MSEETENKQKSMKEHSDKLAKLGMELSKIQFSYKVEEKTSKDYWQKRIEKFEDYNKKALEYYNQIFSLIKVADKEESERFLLRISKFRQLASSLIEIMEKIKENPSIINSKDKQQSQWSREIKNSITEQSNKCLHHERDMNSHFRDFYEKHLKDVLE